MSYRKPAFWVTDGFYFDADTKLCLIEGTELNIIESHFKWLERHKQSWPNVQQIATKKKKKIRIFLFEYRIFYCSLLFAYIFLIKWWMLRIFIACANNTRCLRLVKKKKKVLKRKFYFVYWRLIWWMECFSFLFFFLLKFFMILAAMESFSFFFSLNRWNRTCCRYFTRGQNQISLP